MRLSKTPQGRITLIYVTVVVSVIIAFAIYLVGFVSDSSGADLEERLERQALLVRDLTEGLFDDSPDQARIQSASVLAAEFSEMRVTVFAAEGTVLADVGNSPDAPVASASAPEVVSALNSGKSVSARVETTGGQEHAFVAVPIIVNGETVGVARASRTTSEIDSQNVSLVIGIIFSSAIVLILSVGLAYFLAQSASRSMEAAADGARRFANGDLDYRMDTSSYPGAEELAEAFNQMASTITDQIRNLTTESNHLSVILDTMADGVIVVNSNGQVELMNLSAEWMLESPNREADRIQLAEVVRDHEILQLVSEARATRQTRQAELELVHRRRFLNVIATPLSEGSDEGVLLTLQDVTRLWQVETTRREFVSNVSHELRSPLAAIRAMTETLQDGALNDTDAAQDFLTRILNDTQRMTTMVNELLELSRLESGQAPIHLAPVSLESVVAEIESRFDVSPDHERLKLETNVPDGIPLVMGEADKLNQVLANLVENAVKVTGDGGLISISANATDRWVEVKVSDNGIGIAREHLPHVFERFYKVDRSRRDGGTGLGLAIAKHLVQAHGGDIKVESVEGEGSAFSFTLPRAS
ncbi:MAG: cell wall metabolism sensor histidine kinase WalK [SAR202 cluster bacterium]|nr:cell wall metabolism sensor histidine kinase WalK [SAR202 cluster bacterium]